MRREQTRIFEEGDYVAGKFGHDGYAFDIRDGFSSRQSMSIHLLDDIEHFTRVVHSAGDEVQLVRDREIEDAERAAASARDRMKHCDGQIAFFQRQRAEAKAALSEAQAAKREAKKIPTKIERPSRPWVPR